MKLRAHRKAGPFDRALGPEHVARCLRSEYAPHNPFHGAGRGVVGRNLEKQGEGPRMIGSRDGVGTDGRHCLGPCRGKSFAIGQDPLEEKVFLKR
jgi:hypothetical protein